MKRFIALVLKIFLAPIVRLLFIKRIEGKENLPSRKQGYILVSNHQSYIDILIDGYLCFTRNFHFIGQIDRWKQSSSGKIIKFIYSLFDTIHLDRKDKESRKRAIAKAIEFLEKKEVLIIYPEGRRSRTGKLQRGELGTARIFLETGVPIVPVALSGTFEVMPPKGKLKFKRIVKSRIGKPFYPEDLLDEQVSSLDKNSKEYILTLRKTTDAIMDKISSLKKEIEYPVE